MFDLAFCVASGCLCFGAGLFGMVLQNALPEAHLTVDARKMIESIISLVSLLLALVLGALVSSANGFYTSQKANVVALGARAIELNLAFEQYGPETASLRQDLITSIEEAYRSIWIEGGNNSQSLSAKSSLPVMRKVNAGLAGLQPKTPTQTQAMSIIMANVGIIDQTRLLISLQLSSPISWPLLIVVVSWAVLLFCGFGVMSRLNLTSLVALILGSLSVASAMLMILELNQPFSGIFQIPPTLFEQTIEAIGQ